MVVMEDSPKNEVTDAVVVKKECTKCKFVLVFAFVVLILVAIFAYVVRRQAAVSSPQIPIEQTIPLTGAEIDELMLDLKGTVAYPANPYNKPTSPTAPKK